MALITQYGSLYGAIPQTGGRVFWVAPAASYTVNGRAYTASNDNSGLRPELALLTLARAVALATADVGDVIVLLPGTHSWAASVALSKAGLTIWGLPGGSGNFVRPRASITTSATDEIINVTAADCEIANLRIIPVTAQRGIDFTTAASRLHVHHCSIDLVAPAANTSTIGIGSTTATQAPVHMYFHDIYVDCDSAQGPWLALGDAQEYVEENCHVSVTAGTWAAACTQDGVLGWGRHVRNIYTAQNGGVMTIGHRGTDLTSASAVHFYWNFYGDDVTVPIDNFGAGDAVIAENYKASIGAASGGALITAIT